ncbi:MAG: ROK family protein, partial [Negativicutes bacterium]|nr:ROK family protein [Negativicutes bacterium]
WLDLVAQEDPLAVNIAREMGKDIGKIVAQVVNVLNPTRVFLGGPLRGTLEYYLDDLCRVVKEEAFPDIGKETKVTFSILAKYAGSLGACSLILQEALQEPQSEIFALLEGDDHHEI